VVDHDRVRAVATGTGERFDADAVVVATGADVPTMLRGFGVEIPDATPLALLVRTVPAGTSLRAALNTPRVAVRPTPDGGLVMDSDEAAQEVVANADGTYEVKDDTIQSLMREASAVLLGNPSLSVVSYGVGRKPIPGDGEPEHDGAAWKRSQTSAVVNARDRNGAGPPVPSGTPRMDDMATVPPATAIPSTPGNTPTAAPPVRIGLVGYGFGGRYFHAPLLASAAGCDFMGVVTTSPQRRDVVHAEYPGVATYESIDELARAGAEAVAISTPAATHTALAQQALQLGLAVVCDKPFALDAVAARQTVELSERLGVPLTAYQNRRWDSDFLTVRRLVRENRLGQVTRFESRFERFQPDPGPPAAGAGTLLDFGSHLVDQALVLFGPVEQVYAEMHVRDDELALDDDVFVALNHRSGAHSHLWGSWRQSAPGPRFRVTGTTGTYVVGGMDGQEELLIAGTSPATAADRWGLESEERWGQLFRSGQSTPVPTARGSWDLFYPAFAAAVRGIGTVPVEPRDAIATAMVLDAARQSATHGRPVPVDRSA
jgi:predicted dehydrogenase